MPARTVIAHRGFTPADHSSPHAHSWENTLAAFAAAQELGCDWVESDVHVTADGVPVLHHDAQLDRATTGTGALAQRTAAELRQAVRVQGDQLIPQVQEFFDAFPDLNLNLDLKVEAAIAPTVQIIETLGIHDRVRLASFHDAHTRMARALLSRPVRTSPGITTLQRVVAAQWSTRLMKALLREHDAVQVPLSYRRVPIITRRFVRAVHAAGREVHVWTINEPPMMRHLLELGVDALITDRADLALAVVRDY